MPVITIGTDSSTAVLEAPPVSIKSRFGVDPDKYLDHGSIVIAAITSCTNTSNPSVMVAAGLLAKKAVEHGSKTPPWVKSSLAPGSRVVTDYYIMGLMPYPRRAAVSQIVGYGCTTCIGNFNAADRCQQVDRRPYWLYRCCRAIATEGRISPEVRANYLMPSLPVVAYALAGHISHDFSSRSARTRMDEAGVPARHLAEPGGGGCNCCQPDHLSMFHIVSTIRTVIRTGRTQPRGRTLCVVLDHLPYPGGVYLDGNARRSRQSRTSTACVCWRCALATSMLTDYYPGWPDRSNVLQGTDRLPA